MRAVVSYVILTALLAGCDSATDTIGPSNSSPATPALAAAALAVDGPGVDRSRFQPQLSTNLDWSCRWVSNQTQVLCTAYGKDVETTNGWVPIDVCPDGSVIYRNESSSLVAKRFYNSDYELVQKVLHWFGSGQSSLHADGSGKTASGERNVMETFDYSIPGNTSEAVTATAKGTEGKVVTDQPPHEVLILDKGEVQFDPNGDDFTILSGRWDDLTDVDGALTRVCEALK
jgi:hypothetical protein